MSELAGLGVVQGGAAAIVSIVVLLILRGALVPRSVLTDVRADRDARIAEIAAERDSWRAAHGASEENRHAERETNLMLMEYARTADHILRALPRPAEGVADVPVDQGMATQG